MVKSESTILQLVVCNGNRQKNPLFRGFSPISDKAEFELGAMGLNLSDFKVICQLKLLFQNCNFKP